MKKLLFIGLILVLTYSIFAVEMPRLHTGIMLDAKFYSGDQANLDNVYDTANRYQVRKAAFSLTGSLSDYVDYAFEAGLSTCQGTGNTLKIMEAEIDYAWNDNITFSLKQGHVLRGFSGTTECSNRVPMERPQFFTSMVTCHPLGFVANFNYELPMNADIEFEAAFMNGTTETLNKQHDYNFGAIINTPVSGLAITGVYNHIRNNYSIQLADNSWGYKAENGHRIITGLKYDFQGFNITGEYFQAKGFDIAKRENDAYYLIGSYRINTDFTERITYVQPYARYTFWDKQAESSIESEYTYLDAGLVISLDSTTKIKLNYSKSLDNPKDSVETPDSFIARLQINI
jgi:hypothetical protein